MRIFGKPVRLEDVELGNTTTVTRIEPKDSYHNDSLGPKDEGDIIVTTSMQQYREGHGLDSDTEPIIGRK